MKSDANFKEELIRDFKYDMWNLVSCHPTTQNLRNFTSMSYFCANVVRSENVVKFELKKYRGALFHDTLSTFSGIMCHDTEG